MNTKVVVINGERINYDGSIDYNILSDNVVVYKDSTNEEVIERIKDAGIVVSKEYPLKRDMIEKFDDSVKLLCEAGPGYNNIDLEACKEKGIMVCNIPAYSSVRYRQQYPIFCSAANRNNQRILYIRCHGK